MNLGRWWRQRRARLLQLWAVGLVAACAVTGASAMGYLESLQARALDLLIYLQSPRQPSGLVIVAIDDAAFDALGRRQPLPRDYLARVLRGVTRAGAAAVGFDISLRTAGAPEADRALARAIVEFGARGERRLVRRGHVAAGARPARGSRRGAARGPERARRPRGRRRRRQAGLPPGGPRARLRRRRRERARSRPRGGVPDQLHRPGGQLPRHPLGRGGGDRRRGC